MRLRVLVPEHLDGHYTITPGAWHVHGDGQPLPAGTRRVAGSWTTCQAARGPTASRDSGAPG